MNIYIFIISLLSTFSALALEQKIIYPNSFLTKALQEKIEQHRTDEFYNGRGGLKNYYARFTIPTGTIETPLILITGAEDPTPIWYRTVGKAMKHGFKYIYIIEIRGQGLSQRVSGNKQKLIHINDFNNYYLDFISAIKHIYQFNNVHNEAYVISHSTGSMVLLKSLEKLKLIVPGFNIKAMSLWAPLIRVNVSKMLDNNFIINFINKIESLYRYCCGLFIYKKYNKSDFASNKLTNNLNRFNSYQDLMYNYGHGSKGVSLFWVTGLLKELRQNGILKADIPTLNLKAEHDQIVSNHYSIQNPLLKSYIIKGSKHSFNLESDTIFNEVISKTFNFLLKY